MRKSLKELPNLYAENGNYIFRKVIPAKYRAHAGKREFKRSLRTTDLITAIERYKSASEDARIFMQKLKRGESVEESITFEQALARAESQGRNLIDLKSLLADRLKFIEQVGDWESTSVKSPSNFKSYFNARANDIYLSKLVGAYEVHQAHVLRKLNTSECRRKLGPMKLAIKELIDHLGQDIQLRNLTRDHAVSFQNELRKKIASGDFGENAANKRLIQLRTLITSYLDSIGFKTDELETHFDSMKFEETLIRRDAFSKEYIREHWLKGDPFQTLNVDARNLLFAMLDTGCGLKELCGLDPLRDIKLNADIPHIHIRENSKRTLKTKYRERKIPLMGHALKAFKNCPDGFKRYAGENGHTSASAVINKFLKNNGLDEDGACTGYSVRHLFKDRMREHGISLDIQDQIMGHETPGMGKNYGKGISLKSINAAIKQLEGDFNCAI